MYSEQGTALATVVGIGGSGMTVVGGSLNRLVVSVVSGVTGGGAVAGGAVVAGASVAATRVAGVVLARSGAVVAGAPAPVLGDAGPPETDGAGESGRTELVTGATAVSGVAAVEGASAAGAVEVEVGAGGDRRAATEVVV